MAICGPLAQWIERRWPIVEEPRSRSLRLDAQYWLLTPLLTGVLTRGAVIGLAWLAVTARGEGTTLRTALSDVAARGPLHPAPVLAQLAIALVLADLLSYWSHRLRHRVRALSALHDVHHAPDGLSWSAAARMHPLDDLLDNTLVFFPLLLAGIDPAIVLTLGPALLLHTIYLHANWRLSLGPLEAVLATPAFHRAHHAEAGPPGNFGGVLTVWDRLFGTLRAEPAPRTGLPEPARLPESMLAQLVMPVIRAITR